MMKANQEGAVMKRSGMPFKSVHEIFGIRESPEKLAQGLVHRQNMLTALLIYHQVGVTRSRELLELSRESIEILSNREETPQKTDL
jgi:hypothetical protein